MAKPKGEKKPPSIHTGHRRRTKDEFLANGLNGLPDHRVLELLLFYSIPRGDVNPLAHALIDRFGSLAGVFNATPEQLMEVDGRVYIDDAMLGRMEDYLAQYGPRA